MENEEISEIGPVVSTMFFQRTEIPRSILSDISFSVLGAFWCIVLWVTELYSPVPTALANAF